MNIMISPAKKMITEADLVIPVSKPVFLEDAKRLGGLLAALSRLELKQLFQANDQITELNYQRFQTLDVSAAKTPAVLSYSGLQYQSMAPRIFTDSQWEYINQHLKIISGLYGLLRACDAVVPYRLEMQAKLAVGESYAKGSCLYGYWNSRIYSELTKEDQVILNLASKEYSRAVEPFVKEPVRMISCIFGTQTGDKVKVKATEAKTARGDMVRWLAESAVQNPEEVKEYKNLGYHFVRELSADNTFVFCRMPHQSNSSPISFGSADKE